METAVLNIKGETIGKCELPETLFGHKPEPHFLYEVVTAHLANLRAGNASSKTRSEISGGGKKPWKQKHTGRSRQGSTRSPLWRKGGVVFGPRPHSFRREMPQAKRRLALAQALSAKFAEGGMVIVDKFDIAQPKTKELVAVLRSFTAGRKPLLVSMRENKNVETASRNIRGVSNARPSELNAYDVLNSSKVIMTRAALDNLGGLWSGKGEQK
ncbi:MAG: 50S ribosomal protein L4 [Elusimicrobiales bacterium]|nr:50S ribosomal protein L4 [Elusimicrobiales bacterium]